MDDETSSGSISIDFFTHPSAEVVIVRPDGLEGHKNFSISFVFTGSIELKIGLPILIDYEVIDD